VQFSEHGKGQPPQGLTRPARALVGWMPQEQGEMVLQGNTIGNELTAEQREVASQARESLAARPAGLDQADLVLEPPSQLDEHIARLQGSESAAAFFREGWRVQVVDLARVCAFQPSIFTDSAAERVMDIKHDDLAGIAAVSLPAESPEPPRVQFDQGRQAYIVLSPNPNLRIVGLSSGPVPDQPGAAALGFIVRVMPSLMQVIRFRDRYILRDGYHRALGLLDQGITQVPVFTRTMETIEQVTLPGMLPQDAYLGERPPLLRDYRDDTVARDVRLPAVQRMIVIQGNELSPGG
jgi:hypothetical protein